MPLATATSAKGSRWLASVGEVCRWITLASHVGVLLGLAAGCSSPAGGDTAVRVEAQARLGPSIYSGAKDEDPASQSVVALKVPGRGASFELCTGALLADNVVLTARHCLSQTMATSVSCDQDGRSTSGDHIASDLEPSSIQVFTGPTPLFSATPTAHGRQIFRPQGKVLCNSDIALLVLDRPIAGVKPLTVRLEGGLRKGESIRSVGYGQNDRKIPTGTRLRKDGVGVLAVGRTVSASKTPLGTREFEVGLSTCQGDSGGPAISEATGAVVGVVSRGGECTDDFGHIYTTTSGFAEMFDAAFAAASAAPSVEPRAATESLGPAAGPDAAEPPPAAASGCAVAGPTAPLPTSWLALAGAAVLGLAARRRRR